MSNTLKAMKRVSEVKAKRERIFTKNRLQPKQEAEKALAMAQLEKNVSLVAESSGKKKETIKVAKTSAQRKMEIDQ